LSESLRPKPKFPSRFHKLARFSSSSKSNLNSHKGLLEGNT